MYVPDILPARDVSLFRFDRYNPLLTLSEAVVLISYRPFRVGQGIATFWNDWFWTRMATWSRFVYGKNDA